MLTEGQSASIEQGKDIPYLVAAGDGATAVQFKKAVLGFSVRVHKVNASNIQLILHVSKDAVAHDVARAQGTPLIDMREMKTTIQIRNGQTVALGGIEESMLHKNSKKVPWLHQLPLIGVLFKSHSVAKVKTDVLIFITPKILPSTHD